MSALSIQIAAAAQGDLDTTFGDNGFAFAGFTDAGLNHSDASSLAVTSNGKILVAGSARTSGVNFTQKAIVLARFNGAGAVDSTFGTNGRARIEINGFDFATGLAVQGDGKILVAGSGTPSNVSPQTNMSFLVRLGPDGDLDETFGDNGVSTLDIGVGGSINDLALQPDGRIVIVGRVGGPGTGNDFFVARFKADGQKDTSFGAKPATPGGPVFPNLGAAIRTDFGGSENAFAVKVQADGKIVVVGQTQLGADSSFAVARYSSGGLLDSSFGSTGRVTTNFITNDHGGSTGDSAQAVAIQSDGKIVVAGRAEADTGLARPDFALARYNVNGTLDSTFGNGGRVMTDFQPGARASDSASAVLIQSNGSIVAAGFAGFTGGGTLLAVARYEANGALDSTFGGDGKVTTDSRGRIGRALALQTVQTGIVSEVRFVVAGEGSPANATTRMTVARFRGFTLILQPRL